MEQSAPPFTLLLPVRHGVMDFINLASVNLLLTGVVLLILGASLFDHPLFPASVATVHLYVLGVLTLSLFGLAAHHFPVWTRVAWPWPGLNAWSSGALVVGAWSVFLGIGTDLHRWFLLSASAGVGIACSFYLIQAATVLWKSARRDGIMALLTLSTLSLAGVFLLGAIFLGEYAHGFLPHDRLAMLGTHLTWGIFGWAGTLLWVERILSIQADRHPLIPWSAWGLLLSLTAVPWTLFSFPDQPLTLWSAAMPGLLAWAALGWVCWSAEPSVTRRYRRGGDLCALLAWIFLWVWPIWPDERWRFLFGLFILPGWSLGQLFAAWHGVRLVGLGSSHWLMLLASLLSLVLGLLGSLETVLRMAGLWMILSALPALSWIPRRNRS